MSGRSRYIGIEANMFGYANGMPPETNFRGVRPVITLNPIIKLSKGNGSEGNPYELVAIEE